MSTPHTSIRTSIHALNIHAGPAALEHIARHGLLPQHVGTVPAAAGGPKGLILGPLDRFIFGDWLPQSDQPVDLIGASIGAWRMSTACLHDSVAAFERLERDYIAQHYELPPGQKRPSAEQVSREFGANLQAFYGDRIDQVLTHPRYRLHIVTSRGRHILAREQRGRTALGYLGAVAVNAVSRRALGGWLERVVFSTQHNAHLDALPFDASDYATQQVRLTEANFMPVLQASCSIPFVLQAVHDIPGAPRGAYWDGGLSDYHLHLRYGNGQAQRAKTAIKNIANDASMDDTIGRIVLYPHFQQAVIPGWLDKAFKSRHRATSALDNMVLLAPSPEWVNTLPNAKLPDRTDFERYGQDLAARMAVWNQAVGASQQLADEFAAWLRQPDPRRVLPL